MVDITQTGVNEPSRLDEVPAAPEAISISVDAEPASVAPLASPAQPSATRSVSAPTPTDRSGEASVDQPQAAREVKASSAPSLSKPRKRKSGPAKALVLVRSLSRLTRSISSRQLGREFQCVICLEHCAVEERVVLQDCPAADRHAACVGCLSMYLEGRIGEGRVADLRCPLFGNEDCSAVATDAELEHLLEAETFAKYKRFGEMKDDPTLRECPDCGEMLKPNQSEHGTILAEMKCSKGHRFCFYHSNAHGSNPGDCETYSLAQVTEQRKALAASGAKECPNCHLMIEKMSGCNHMTCPFCKADWCWICGRQLAGKGSLGWHYNPSNPVGCAQFATDKFQPRSWITFWARVMAFPGSLIGLIIVWATIPVWCTIVGFFAAVALVAAVQLAWLPVGLALFCFLAACGASEDHAMLIMFSPMSSAIASLECLGCISADEESQVDNDQAQND